MTIDYGFQATMTAKEGKVDELVDLLLSGPTVGPSAHEGCLVFLVSRSATNPDVVHLVEGWVSEEVHHAVFNDPESQAYIARSAELVADAQYGDFVPVGGKANLTPEPVTRRLGRLTANDDRTTAMTPVRPDLDRELNDLLAAMPELPPLSAETLPAIRPYSTVTAETALAGHELDRRDVTVSSLDGTPLPLTILSPAATGRPRTAAPCIYWVHGGGMVMGDRFSQIDIPLEWLEQFGAVVVSVDYRLAPEASGATLVEDSYAGLSWVAAHADQLGIDPTKIIVAGTSAGGGLAAGTTLLARDRQGPPIAAQILICPMLDHRNTTASSHQFAGPGVWSREANEFGWRSVLGDLAADEVSSYVSPAIAEDLSGLPTTYIDAGSAEVFRDEDVAYATRIWAAGGQAELHIWAGGFHGFDALFPRVRVSQTARDTRSDWLDRVLRCPAPTN